MALKNMSDLLSIIGGRFTNKEIQRKGDGFKSPQPNIITDPERRKLVARAAESDATRLPMGMSFTDYLKESSKHVANERIENDRIITMAPEISQAASIMIPSILAPNDLRDSQIRIVCKTPGLDTDQQKKISDKLTEFFESYLNLSTALPSWIDEALYRSGSRPLLLVPLTTLDAKLRDTRDMLKASVSSESMSVSGVGSLESWSAYSQYVKKDIEGYSPFGITNAPMVGATESVLAEKRQAAVESVSSNVKSKIESLFDSLREPSDVGTGQKKAKQSTYNRSADTQKKKEALEKVISSIVSFESIGLTDNSDTVRSDKSKNSSASEKIGKQVKTKFSEAPFLELPGVERAQKMVGNPIFMELPPESVVPIYTPGSPNDHLGYFILLDERGNPLDIDDFNENGIHASPDLPNQTNFTQLYQAYGFNGLSGNPNGPVDVISTIYQSILESYLSDTLKGVGFADVSLGSDSSVFRYLFSRYLQQRRSKILFVPKEMMTYFAFRYDKRGMGVSKLNDVKFILSLRISLMVCRTMAAFNAAIDRRKISVQYDKNFTGDYLESLMTVQREYIRKSAITFTHDPMNIAQQIASKGITIAATGMPGLPELSVSQEPNERTTTSIDDALAEDLKNLLILSLDIPPAAMNNLSDSEYSRSIATTNLFFSRKLVGYQKVVCMHATDFIRKFATFSSEVQSLIHQQISENYESTSGTEKSKGGDDKTKTGASNATESKTANGDDEKGSFVAKDEKKVEKGKTATNAISVEEIISSISVTLPSPNIAPDFTQFENLEKLMSSTDTVVNGMFGDDAAANDADLAQALVAIKGITKSKIITEFLQGLGFGNLNIPDLTNIDTTDILASRQALINVANALRAHQKFIAEPGKYPVEDPNSFNAGGGMGGGFGGGFGGGMDGGMGGGMDGGMGDSGFGSPGGDTGGFGDFSQGAGDISQTGDVTSDGNPDAGSKRGNDDESDLI